MNHIYVAHINERTGEKQTVKEHCEGTAKRCQEWGIPILKDMLYNTGLLHDIGKYQDSFQRRINGESIQVEHSTCGALEAKENYPDAVGLLMEFCIAGHHTGLPDGGFSNDTPDLPTLSGRLNRKMEDYTLYQKELSLKKLDRKKMIEFMLQDCEGDLEKVISKFSFLTRYCFSCLTDADSLDTADFCQTASARPLRADFSACLKKMEDRFHSFQTETSLQKARSVLQQQVYQKSNVNSEIYLMNMPTGSGKTLCSLKFALERALAGGKKRIIYVIPYNSIIDQTAQIFETLFKEDLEILRHQSTFSYEEEENGSEDYRDAAKNAVENWDAPFILTTAVQFFDSIYANKRGKLRKFHNMADSILIFDEAHFMPVDYLQPCLQAVSYLTKYLNSEAVFLTATMPDFRRLLQQYALSNSRILDLIEDQTLFSEFQKCEYRYLGGQTGEEILNRAALYPSCLIIANKRKTVQKIFRQSRGKKFHLSTYMTSFDRKKVIEEIREALKKLEDDFPQASEIPEDRRITIVSTSLIEAGVDLDVYTVFRERSGLDNILQAGGRCNREGKRKKGKVFVFDLSEEGMEPFSDERSNLTKGLLEKYEDISDPRCIEEYYNRLFFVNKENIRKNTISRETRSIYSIPFKRYAEEWNFIDSKTVSVVVPRDEKSRGLVKVLQATGIGSVRELQNYTCSVYQNELDELIRQHAAEDFGTGIWCLVNSDYYQEDTGISFEARDYIL